LSVKVHHTAICPADLDASLRFYIDGLGFEQIFDERFEGDWPALFAAPSNRLRSVFLGDPADQSGGILELVSFDEQASPAANRSVNLSAGFFLVSLYCDLDSTLDRLAEIGLVPESRITVHGVGMAVVRDPDGTRVELIDLPPSKA